MNKIVRVQGLDCSELKLYHALSEPELAHFYEPAPGIFIAETPMIIERALAAGFQPISMLVETGFEDEALKLIGTKLRDEALKLIGTETRDESLKLIEGMSDDLKNAFDIVATNASENGNTSTNSADNTAKTSTNSADNTANAGANSDIPIYVAEAEVLSKITGYKLTRGMLAAMRRRECISVEQTLENCRRIVVLENVMNPTNVGAIFRSAAALGMDAILLTEGCADPLYRRAARVAMGTCFAIPWTYIGMDYLEILKQAGFRTVAMALRNDSCTIDDPALHAEKKLAVIMGTEGEGLCQRTIDSADYTVKIPMSGGVDSLNVAAASAVAFWELGK